VSDWSGEDYARVSGLQRTIAADAVARLAFTRRVDAHNVAASNHARDPRTIAAAHAIPSDAQAGPWFVRADARRPPFGEQFDVVASFNALHWVPQQRQALAEIATVAHPGARVLIQVVCAGERTSLQSVAMAISRSPAELRK
jgi:trans-aconitate 2-methyltransferase